jgi:hypothetical protein
MDIPIGNPAYSVEIKSVEMVLHMPEPLMETLGRLAQSRHCSVEQLIIARPGRRPPRRST